MQRHRRVKKQSYVKISWVVIAVILILCFTFFIIFHTAERPMTIARGQTETIAKKYAGLRDVNSFYTSNLGKTYYSVSGIDNKNKNVFVIVAKKGGTVTVINSSSGISEQQAKDVIQRQKHPSKFNGIGLTLIKSKPYWVASYMNSKGRLCFTTISFKNGQIYKSIENI
ncbi:DUF5590 domain-containing protein [Lentilactobacillus kefiri]|uniref:Cell wall elongation regulator TseB-like domain-containing protein n=1 Tax=Lentilactobacillus kefiri TaxID=33962 RepID=A0A511DW39_LENKE|nr:DUF5590 domain-containing protein [Lentilactobacillus kefiri]KRL62717.1 hypothetical protein FD08_GL002586 [Lentilactobacillus parakefiri DSM 10551]MCJ2160670.1 DUF5590 domain-containing protein [Lentilactobacillus kefiri]MCP9367925.1 DUF5590 domain-containing protein [Lentilactobacillus kefiri]MDH5107525.1 DUF5590 domain-containing protein [Lentilactobacillus kefiri]MDM7491901.1 DUF5590 domain-containing protein [Lentilactobacillus kefiri]